MRKQQKIILAGDGPFAEVALEYFTHDSPYEVAAFAVERAFKTRSACLGLPVADIEDIEKHYPPAEYKFHAAVAYNQLNRVRVRLIGLMYGKGYESVSYISDTVRIWPSVRIGGHCFIFENNVIQPYVTIGDNCVIWSGNHIGHHSSIGDGCFLSSHIALSGFTTMGLNCFVGVNATTADNVTIGDDCLIGAGAAALRSLEAGTVIRPAAGVQRQGAKILMGVE